MQSIILSYITSDLSLSIVGELKQSLSNKYSLTIIDTPYALISDSAIMNTSLAEKVKNFWEETKGNLSNELFLEMLDYKASHKSSFLFIDKTLMAIRVSLPAIDKLMLKNNVPEPMMIYLKLPKQQILQDRLTSNAIIGYDLWDDESPEKLEEERLERDYSELQYIKSYYQQHNRYHEINISGKTEQEVYEEVCEVIEGM